MTNILLFGACGKMGHVIHSCVSARDDCKIAAGIDLCAEPYADFNVYKNPAEITEPIDVIIDFSHPSALGGILSFAKKHHIPAVISTTGMSAQEIAKIEDAAKTIPVFFSFNMSLGINLLAGLAQKAVSILGNDFDIEIVEAHHNQKIDAPSGTALLLANSINEACGDEYYYEYDRHSKRKKRDAKEIGIHSIRGGTIVGEHEIIFSGRDEVITLSHSARSKEIFAVGAVNAAVFMPGKEAGMYDMSDLVASK